MAKAKDFRPERGFSLIQLLIGLTVMGILATLAAPAFRHLLTDLRIHSAVNGFERVLRHARREAVSRRYPARLCPTLTGVRCDHGAAWEDGWISYLDRSGGPERDPEDPLLHVFGPRKLISIHFNGGNRISINPLGRLSRNASMVFCSSDNDHPGLRLVMIHSGRLRVDVPASGCELL